MSPRVGLRIAYDGARFNGFQRQPGRRTVEGDLLDALRRVDAIRDPRSARYRASSRTDSGVSALGNAVSIDTDFDPTRLPKALNSSLKDIWCVGHTLLPADFNVRHAVSRTYACYILDQGHDVDDMKRAAGRLVGTHDFSCYARIDGRNPVRTVRRLEIERLENIIEVIVEGDSFLWNQVRRMAWALDLVGLGRAAASDVSPERFSLARAGLVPASSLILLDVDIGHEFEAPRHWGRTLSELSQSLVSSIVRKRLLEVMISSATGGRASGTW